MTKELIHCRPSALLPPFSKFLDSPLANFVTAVVVAGLSSHQRWAGDTHIFSFKKVFNPSTRPKSHVTHRQWNLQGQLMLVMEDIHYMGIDLCRNMPSSVRKFMETIWWPGSATNLLFDPSQEPLATFQQKLGGRPDRLSFL